MGIERDDTVAFTFSTSEKFVNIISDDSEFSKSWIFIENKKDFQVWKSTDGTGVIQRLELKKKE